MAFAVVRALEGTARSDSHCVCAGGPGDAVGGACTAATSGSRFQIRTQPQA
jgi:hypothetical protein